MTISDLAYKQGGNKNGAGLTQRFYVELAQNYPGAGETLTDNVITAIAAGPSFSLFEAARPSGKFKVVSNGDADAKSFNVELELFIPRLTPEKSYMLGKLINYPCVIICEDRIGNLRRTGKKWDGVELDLEEMTEGKNGYLLKGKIEGLSCPPDYLQDDTIIPTAG